MTNVFIIHGSYGNPDENWLPWLKLELERIGCDVFAPMFPTPNNQSLKSWNEIFENYETLIEEDSIVVGHSLGVAFLLSVIEKKPVKAAFFVSGFTSSLGKQEFDRINKTFVERKFDWKKIRKNCKKFCVFHSDNDPYVPLKKAERLSKLLGTKIILVEKAGHFNEKSGYWKFDLLLENMMRELDVSATFL